MPLVQIKGVGGYLTLAQKQEMIRKVTDAEKALMDLTVQIGVYAQPLLRVHH